MTAKGYAEINKKKLPSDLYYTNIWHIFGVIRLKQHKKPNIMNSKEIYQTAQMFSEEEARATVLIWSLEGKTNLVDTYSSLVRLGDSPALAVVTAMAVCKFELVGPNSIYRKAYQS